MEMPLTDALVVVDNNECCHGVRDNINILGKGRVIDTSGNRIRIHTRHESGDHRARIPIFDRLHPGAALSHQQVPDRRRDTELLTTVRTGAGSQRTAGTNYTRAAWEDLIIGTRGVGLKSPGELNRADGRDYIDIGDRMPANLLYSYPSGTMITAM
jgi:hypothetical protein